MAVLPPALQPTVRALPEDELLEVVMDLGRPPEARLTDRTVRRLQHRLVARYHLDATSVGSEPLRHLVILPPSGAGLAPEEPGG